MGTLIMGTCHFPSRKRAADYYSMIYADAKAAVREKLANNEIKIGAPAVRGDHEKVVPIDGGMRYGIAMSDGKED